MTVINNDILCFTKTQIQPHSTSSIQSLFKNFMIYFNNNSNKVFSLAYGLPYNLELIDRENFPGLSGLNIAKSLYSKGPLFLLILYKTNSQPQTLFSDCLP